MNKNKSQTMRIIETYITVTVLIIAFILIISGISISKINTDYMETGVRSGKIVAERVNSEISLVTYEGIEITPESNTANINKILSFLPPPINTSFYILKEISDNISDKQKATKE